MARIDYSAITYEVRRDEHLRGQTIVLDGCWFENCIYTDCTLIFEGRQPFGYRDSQFIRCGIVFDETAFMVLDRIIMMMPGIFDNDDIRSTLLSLNAGKTVIQ